MDTDVSTPTYLMVLVNHEAEAGAHRMLTRPALFQVDNSHRLSSLPVFCFDADHHAVAERCPSAICPQTGELPTALTPRGPFPRTS